MSKRLVAKDPMEIVYQVNGREYIPLQKFHRDVKPYKNFKTTMASVGKMETYDDLLESGHIFILSSKYAKSLKVTKLLTLMKSNSYQKITLIDRVAQKAIEHHFKKTSKQAVTSSKENALLATAGLDLSVLVQNESDVVMLRALQDSRIAKRQADMAMEKSEKALKLGEENKKRLDRIDPAIDAGYWKIRAYANRIGVEIDKSESSQIGRVATQMCKERGFEVNRTPCKEYGWINEYPIHILEEIFKVMGCDTKPLYGT